MKRFVVLLISIALSACATPSTMLIETDCFKARKSLIHDMVERSKKEGIIMTDEEFKAILESYEDL